MAPLLRRDDVDPSQGVLDPHDINNAGFFFLFALIGVAFVLGGIWFFFWAKDGGFHFKEDDWDDYKSTVLRRKGPNGTVLSNATRSTKLGGGSVYKGYDEDARDYDESRTVITESTGLSGITAGPSDIYAREKREEKRRQRRERKGRSTQRKKNGEGDVGDKGRKGDKGDRGDKGVVDEDAERAAREQLRNYRHERAARVGGLNKEAEGSEWEGSTNAESSVWGRTEGSRTEGSRTDISGRTEGGRTEGSGRTEVSGSSAGGGGGGGEGGKGKPRGGGIRKVYSVADRTTARENERLREEARRMREQGAVARRDFSYQRATGAASQSQLSESLLEGSDGGTKSYHHPLPELKEHRRREREREREERRARRGGYVRGNTIDEEVD